MPTSTPWLQCRVRSTLCALPVDQVIEIMRPLPVSPVARAPECVLGMCVIRGEAVPVVDLARLLLGEAGEPTRFVCVRAGERRVALAVDGVPGTLELSAAQVAEVPPLLARASAAVEAITTLDKTLLVLFESSRVLPAVEVAKLAEHV